MRVEKGPVGKAPVIAVETVFDLKLPVGGDGKLVGFAQRDQLPPTAMVEPTIEVT
jgi:hypothetical protein